MRFGRSLSLSAVLLTSCMVPTVEEDGGVLRDDAGSVTDAGIDAGPEVFDAGIGCPSIDLTPYRSSTCFCGTLCDCYLDVPYGAAAMWNEPSTRANVKQAIDLYVPKGTSPSGALVLWAHANGDDKTMSTSGALTTRVALPLLQAGTAFASVEFRHPAVNQAVQAPRTDISDAVQFLRCQAATLHFTPDRLAAIGRSRGTLAVWTAVQNDAADPQSTDPVKRQSTRLRGVWAMAAQTSYWGQWIGETFITDTSRQLFFAFFGTTNYGHAIGDVTPDDPPVRVVYEDPLQVVPFAATRCQQIDCVHLPNFGDQLCKSYADAGIPDRCTSTYSLSPSAMYDAVPFLNSVLQP